MELALHNTRLDKWKRKHVWPANGPTGALDQYLNMFVQAGKMVFEGNILDPCLGGTYGIQGQVYRLASCPEIVRLCDANLMHGSSPEATTQLVWTQSLQESDSGDKASESPG